MGRAPAMAKSLTVPKTASLPMSPPGKNSGVTVKLSVVIARRTPSSSTTALSCGGACPPGRPGLPGWNAGRNMPSIRPCISRPPPPCAICTVACWSKGMGQLRLKSVAGSSLMGGLLMEKMHRVCAIATNAVSGFADLADSTEPVRI